MNHQSQNGNGRERLLRAGEGAEMLQVSQGWVREQTENPHMRPREQLNLLCVVCCGCSNAMKSEATYLHKEMSNEKDFKL